MCWVDARDGASTKISHRYPQKPIPLCIIKLKGNFFSLFPPQRTKIVREKKFYACTFSWNPFVIFCIDYNNNWTSIHPLGTSISFASVNLCVWNVVDVMPTHSAPKKKLLKLKFHPVSWWFSKNVQQHAEKHFFCVFLGMWHVEGKN